MDHFNYRGGKLFAEDLPLAGIAAEVGTPCYIYSRATIERHWHAFDDAFEDYPHRICYAVKANSNLAILDLLARLGSGFDIVSGGELQRVLKAGGKAGQCVFSGVGKSDEEIELALSAGIGCINIESAAELELVEKAAARRNGIAAIAIRVNPNVDAKTHPYIATGLHETKFGVPIQEAISLYQQASREKHIAVKGLACHIGSQITEVSPYIDALACLIEMRQELLKLGITIDHLDLGGGLGVRYRQENPPLPADFTRPVVDFLKARELHLRLDIEPGRAIMANAGILLTRVRYLKSTPKKNFAVVDAGMNDLIRPALYQAWQDIVPINEGSSSPTRTYDVVGPICESGDKLGIDRPLAIAVGDLLAVRTAGAYCSVMSSNYNSRPRIAEVLVDRDRYHVIRKAETFEQMIDGEELLPE